MTTPQRGHFVLHSNVMPPVTAGDYELVSDQTGTPFDVEAERTHVTVSSPRYTMPPEQILSTFPPANAEGAFGDRLPQIALKRRTLPWERNPAGAVTVSPTPWLALVVVAEGEAELSATTPVEQCVTAGTTLLDPDDRDVAEGLYLAVTETVVGKIFPTQEDLPLLAHVREVDVQDTELAGGDDDGWLAVVLANRLPVYDTAADKPVRYLACLVNLEGQLGELPPPSPPVDFFEYEPAQDWSPLASVEADADKFVMGTGSEVAALEPAGFEATAGLPAIGAELDGTATSSGSIAKETWSTGPTEAVATAALDADAPRLVRDTMGIGFHLPIEHYAIERMLRFPVLAYWSFTTSEGATFETLMQDLDVGLVGTLPVPEPEAPPKPEGPTVVATGHVELEHQSRRGDGTQAWYRGGLVPHPTDREQPDEDGRLPVAHAADQLRRIVPDGHEDLAYAAAYEIGRLLALSQLSIVSALLRFRGEQFGIARVKHLLESIVPPAVLPPARRPLRPRAPGREGADRNRRGRSGPCCRGLAADRGPRPAARARRRPRRRRRRGARPRPRRDSQGRGHRRHGRGARRDRGAGRRLRAAADHRGSGARGDGEGLARRGHAGRQARRAAQVSPVPGRRARAVPREEPRDELDDLIDRIPDDEEAD